MSREKGDHVMEDAQDIAFMPFVACCVGVGVEVQGSIPSSAIRCHTQCIWENHRYKWWFLPVHRPDLRCRVMRAGDEILK